MIPYLLYPIVRFALWIFFRRLEVRGCEQVPVGRPLIFLANHPNVMLDALLLAAFAPGPFPRFLGKTTLFKNALYTFLLRRMGAIPVARSQDPGGQVGRNQDMLREACQTLEQGGSLALFPEGLSRAGLQLRPFKPGAARIALRVEDETQGRAGLCIIPVGLTYSDPGLFRSEVVLHFGTPVEVRPFLESYRTNRGVAAQELTALLYQRLVRLTLHLENPDLESGLRDLAAVYTENILHYFPASAPLSQRLLASQEMVRAVSYYARTEPELVHALSERLRRHLDHLHRLDLQPQALSPLASPAGWGRLALTLLLAPLALYGFLGNLLPYFLPQFYVRGYREEPEMLGTVKFALGALAFPLFYLVLTFIAHWSLGWQYALLFGCTLPGSALVILFYKERLLEKWPLWKKLIAPRQRRHQLRQLAQERRLLIGDLDQIKDRYLATPIEPQGGADETA